MLRTLSRVRSFGLPLLLKNSPASKCDFPRFIFHRPRDPINDFSSAMRYIEHEMRELERQMNRAMEEFRRTSPIRLGSPFFWRDGREVPVVKPGDKDDSFRITLDASSYRPENIKVAVKDRTVTVRIIQTDTAPDGAQVEREYTHQSVLPDDVDPDNVRAELSPDGRISIITPLKVIKEIPVTNEGTKNDNK